MSISSEKLEHYKLDHETIHSINSERLYKHIEQVKKETIYEDDYQAVKRYIYFLESVLRDKPDYDEMLKEKREKLLFRKGKQMRKGSQKLSKSKRKKNRLYIKERQKDIEKNERLKKNLQKQAL